MKLLSSQSRIQVLKAILAKIRPESAREALPAAEALRGGRSRLRQNNSVVGPNA
ncbi:MAG TPA: hypothetical protein VGF39_06795 [Stellaceae bacterium]